MARHETAEPSLTDESVLEDRSRTEEANSLLSVGSSPRRRHAHFAARALTGTLSDSLDRRLQRCRRANQSAV